MATTKPTTKKAATTTKPAVKKTTSTTTKTATAKTTTAKASTAASKPKAAPKASKPAVTSAKPAAHKGNGLTPEQHYKMIQDAAYFMAEKNGFAGGAMDYWIAAEAQIEMQLSDK